MATEADTAQAVLHIDLGAIVANWRVLCGRHPSGPVAAVVKADAYGLGAQRVAAVLHAAGCRHFFVAYLEEALAIRDVVPDAMLAVLSGPIPGTEGVYVTHDLTPVLGSLDEIDRWRRVAALGHKAPPTDVSSPGDDNLPPLGGDNVSRPGDDNVSWPGDQAREGGLARPPTTTAEAAKPVTSGLAKPRSLARSPDHNLKDQSAGCRNVSPAVPTTRHPAILHIDTGMSRLGLDARELSILAADPARLAGIDLCYVMTHLVAAETTAHPINHDQLTRFAAARATLPPTPASLANSSGIFLGAAFGSDLARPGAALYGINPTPGHPNPMRPVVRLLARVLAIRDIPAGTSVGYNATWTARRPSRIATAAIGYADGYHRSLSNRAFASFDGTPVPLVGRVSMDLTTFDVTDHPAIQTGSWLEILGPAQPADDLATAANTNGYDVLTSLGRRFRRVYQTA